MKSQRTSKRRLSVRERRRRKRIYKASALVVGLALVLGGILYLLHLPHTRIQEVLVTGTKDLDAEIIQRDTDIFLSKPLYVLPSDSYFVFSRKSLAQYLHQRYSRIDTLDIRVRNFDTIEIAIDEYETGFYARMLDTTYAVSPDGVLLEEELPGATSTHMMLYLNPEHFSTNLGERILPKQDFASLVRFADDLSKLGVEPELVQLENPIEYLVLIPGGVKLIINPHNSYDTYREVVREILPYKEFGYNFADSSFGRELDYINLRYGKKILYCYYGDECDDNYPLLYD